MSLVLIAATAACGAIRRTSIQVPASSPIIPQTLTATLMRTSTNTPKPTSTSTSTATSTPRPSPTPHLTNPPSPTATSTRTPTPTATPATKLRLRLRGATGEPVAFSKAVLFVAAWGETDSQEFATADDLLVLPLEEDSVRSYWPWTVGDLWHEYRLYIEADGYVSMMSKPMSFIGMETRPGLATQVVVEFHNRPKVTISEGETVEAVLTMRRPQSRYLRFVDDDRKPVSGVGVTSHMFWTNANHCGIPTATLLADGVSDEDGRVLIPDGDFEYAFELSKPFYHLRDWDKDGPMYLVTYLSDHETAVELHRLQKQSLEMIVQKDGTPLSNETLFGHWIGCPCGLCAAEIATTDENGRISVDDFYPEEWAFIYFRAKEKLTWEADPKLFSGGEVIEVELSD